MGNFLIGRKISRPPSVLRVKGVRNVVPFGTDETISRIVSAYSDMLLRLACVRLGSAADAEDAVQEAFLRLLTARPIFRDPEHEKAWLIRVATNICRDMLRFQARHPKIAIDDLSHRLAAPEQTETFIELLELPPKLKIVIYLHYVDGYSVKEIAGILKISESAVKKRLQRGRMSLRTAWKEAKIEN